MMERNQLKPHRLKIVEFVRTWCAYLFLQYELITCTCMFEPWEKIFIRKNLIREFSTENLPASTVHGIQMDVELLYGLVLTIFSLVTYSSWVYLPRYLMSLFDCFMQMTGTLTAIPFDW